LGHYIAADRQWLSDILHAFAITVRWVLFREIHKNKYPALLKRITDYAHKPTTKAVALFTGKCLTNVTLEFLGIAGQSPPYKKSFIDSAARSNLSFFY
jgi:hypothetical protein